MSSAKIRNRDSSVVPTARVRRSLTIRTRLTLWSAGMIAAVYLILAAIVFSGLIGLVQTEVDTLVQGQSQELIARVHQSHDDLDEAEQEIRKELARRVRNDFRFRVLDEAGLQLLTSDPDQQFPPVPADRGFGSEGFTTLSGSRTHSAVRIYRQPILLGTRTVWAEVTYSLDQMNANLRHYGMLWLGTVPLVILLAALGGFLLARRSLRPVAEMIANARKVEGDPSGNRMEVRGTGDELDQLAETLNVMLDRIERHVEQITQFTADASHELRSPLAALRGSAEVALTRRSSTEELRTVLENAVDQYDRLTRIAEDLLLLARVDTHRNNFRFDRITTEDVVHSAHDLYGAVAESRNITLTCSAPGRSEIEGDFDRLLQLLGNLIDNAVKNTPAGGRVDLLVEQTGGDALLNRVDIYRALDQYAAAEAALQMEIAAQRPNFALGPAFRWREGQQRWTLGVSFDLPIFNRNQGPIGEAEARRETVARDFDRLQASAVAEVEQASATYRAAMNESQSVDELNSAAEDRLTTTQQLFDLREVDYTAVVAARIESALARTAGVLALRRVHAAVAMIEDAIQKPIEDEFSLPDNLELRRITPQEGLRK